MEGQSEPSFAAAQQRADDHASDIYRKALALLQQKRHPSHQQQTAPARRRPPSAVLALTEARKAAIAPPAPQPRARQADGRPAWDDSFTTTGPAATKGLFDPSVKRRSSIPLNVDDQQVFDRAALLPYRRLSLADRSMLASRGQNDAIRQIEYELGGGDEDQLVGTPQRAHSASSAKQQQRRRRAWSSKFVSSPAYQYAYYHGKGLPLSYRPPAASVASPALQQQHKQGRLTAQVPVIPGQQDGQPWWRPGLVLPTRGRYPHVTSAYAQPKPARQSHSKPPAAPAAASGGSDVLRELQQGPFNFSLGVAAQPPLPGRSSSLGLPPSAIPAASGVYSASVNPGDEYPPQSPPPPPSSSHEQQYQQGTEPPVFTTFNHVAHQHQQRSHTGMSEAASHYALAAAAPISETRRLAASSQHTVRPISGASQAEESHEAAPDQPPKPRALNMAAGKAPKRKPGLFVPTSAVVASSAASPRSGAQAVLYYAPPGTDVSGIPGGDVSGSSLMRLSSIHSRSIAGLGRQYPEDDEDFKDEEEQDGARDDVGFELADSMGVSYDQGGLNAIDHSSSYPAIGAASLLSGYDDHADVSLHTTYHGPHPTALQSVSNPKPQPSVPSSIPSVGNDTLPAASATILPRTAALLVAVALPREPDIAAHYGRGRSASAPPAKPMPVLSLLPEAQRLARGVTSEEGLLDLLDCLESAGRTSEEMHLRATQRQAQQLQRPRTGYDSTVMPHSGAGTSEHSTTSSASSSRPSTAQSGSVNGQQRAPVGSGSSHTFPAGEPPPSHQVAAALAAVSDPSLRLELMALLTSAASSLAGELVDDVASELADAVGDVAAALAAAAAAAGAASAGDPGGGLSSHDASVVR